MRDRGSHKPFGSLADLQVTPGRRVPIVKCVECGCAISRPTNRKYCAPCSSFVHLRRQRERRAAAAPPKIPQKCLKPAHTHCGACGKEVVAKRKLCFECRQAENRRRKRKA